MNDYLGTIKKNTMIDESIHLVELTVPGFDGVAEAGQFVMVTADTGYDPFLRRPYSIFDCKRGTVELLVRIVGKGSACIAGRQPGSTMRLFGPLGTGFPVAKKGAHLLVAGGMGIAPLWFLASTLERSCIDYGFIFGERIHSQLGRMVKSRHTDVQLVTDDGSYGIKGVATDALFASIDEHKGKDLTVYGCGPLSMLERLVEISLKRRLTVYISMEERMACGMGVCLGCSVKKRDGSGYTTVCKDGPVFAAHEVVW